MICKQCVLPAVGINALEPALKRSPWSPFSLRLYSLAFHLAACVAATAAHASALPFPPLASEAFDPPSILTGEQSLMTITLSNSNDSAIVGVEITDNYPDGMVNIQSVDTPLSNSCGGNLTATPNAASLTLTGGSIPAQDSCLISLPVIGTSAGSFDNPTGTVSSSNAPPGASATATLTVTDGQLLPAPAVNKAFAPAAVPPGVVSRLKITLTNPDGGRAITGAQFMDSYPPGIINVDDANPTALVSDTCGGTATADANGLSTSLVNGVVPPGGSCSVVVNVVATSTAMNSTGPVTSNDAQTGNSASATLTVAAGALLDAPSVTKSFTPDHVISGDTVATSVMAITLTNNDPYDVTGVAFTDDYPIPLRMANAPSGVVLANTCGGNLTAAPNGTSVMLAGGSIPANDSCVVKIQVYGTSPGTTDNHTGPVSSDNANDGADAEAILTVTGGAAVSDLTLAKSHAANFAQGQTDATYTLVATNVGGAPTNGSVSVADVLPSSLVATDMRGSGWTCDLQTTSCTRADALDPGMSYQAITVTVDVAANAPPSVTNSAAVSGGGEVDTSNDNAADPTTIDPASAGPDVTVTKSHIDDFVRGQTGAVYSLIAHNVGNAPTSGTVVLTDTMPGALTATDMNGPGWTCDLQTTSCTRSDPLPAGQSYPAITLWVDVAANAPSTVLNTATVGGGGEMNANNDAASDLTTIAASSGSTLQAIAFSSTAPDNAQVAGPTYQASATASSGLPVLLTIDGSSATVCAISNGMVSFIGAGTCTIDANQGGDAIYAPAQEVQQSFSVASAGGVTPQAIAFTSTAPNNAVVAGPIYAVSATASSGLPVVLTIDASSATVCTINAGTVSFIGAGTCTIDANQGGDATFAAAPQVQQSFPVAGAGGLTPQAITFTSTAPVNATVGGPTYFASATASSGLPVVLTIDAVSDTVCTVNNGWVTFIGAGPCVIDANQGGNATYAAAPQMQQSFVVADAGGLIPQAITFTSMAPMNAIVAGPTYLATATADSGLPVVLTIDATSDTICTINNGTVSFIGAGTCTIDANQGGDATYAPAPQVQQSFAVANAGGLTPQMITFTSAAPMNATVAGPQYLATATADSGLPVVLTIDVTSDTVCTINNGTVTFIGAGICTIDANQGGDATYAPAPQVQQPFPVAQAGGMTPQMITFTSTAPVNATVGGPTYLATATADSGLPVVLTIDAVSATVCTINSGTVSFIGAGTCAIDANQGGDAFYAPAPQAQQSFAVGEGAAPTVSCLLPRQVDVVGDTVSLDLSLLFTPPAGQSLSYSATNVPPSLSITGSLLTGTLQANDVLQSPYSATLTATTNVPGGAGASEDVMFEVLPIGEILLRDGFDGSDPIPICQ